MQRTHLVKRAANLRVLGIAAMLVAVPLTVGHAFFGLFQATMWYFPLVFILQIAFLVCLFASMRIQKAIS